VCVRVLTAMDAGNSHSIYLTCTTISQKTLKTVSLTRFANSSTQIRVLPHGCTNLGHPVVVATRFCKVATKFCKLATNICGSSTLLHFTRLLLKILRQFLVVSKICVPLSQTLCPRCCSGVVGTELSLTG
jgi:hypothetical protein